MLITTDQMDWSPWLASNGAVLTAGHCVDGNPDKLTGANYLAGCCCCGNACCSACLPDGQADPGFLTAVVEFQVPASLANGVPVAASLNDQYPVNFNTGGYIWFQYPGCDPDSNFIDIQTNGVGTDWAVFSVGRNSNTLLTPHIAQGAFFRVAAVACTDDCTTCVTGYGIDNTPWGPGDNRCLGGTNNDQTCSTTSPTQNCVAARECPGGACCQPATCPEAGVNVANCNANNFRQQSACGPYQDFHSEGTLKWHEYKADTTAATSGSPVTISYGPNMTAIGINTHSGCPDDGNKGT